MSAAGDWDSSPFFESTTSAAYETFVDDLLRDLALVDGDEPLAERLVLAQSVDARFSHLETYLVCAGSADANDDAVNRATARLAETAASMDKAMSALELALGQLEEDEFSKLLESPKLRAVQYRLQRMRRRSKTRMAGPLEDLAADLGVTGLSAWSRLYNQITGNLSFELKVDGATETHPISRSRAFMEDAEPHRRQAAFDGTNRAWKSVSTTLAACLNNIAGTRLTIYQRRGQDDFLSPALFDAGISRATLDAMFQAVESRNDVPARYYRLKAQALGKDALSWSDLGAPWPASDGGPSWDEATEVVDRAFSEAYPALGDFSREAIDKRWIDHTPRAGKRPGGFCSTSHVLGESRIFMTYADTAGDLMTLAHELGHAFHGRVLDGLEFWQKRYPMTLAETASTFAEAIVNNAMKNDGSRSGAARVAMLNGSLADAAQMLCNIPARFYFETAFYERRRSGECSVDELCGLMVTAQRRAYGDALSPGGENPWFWASKLHFYISELSFYNFPYTFGYLFSLAIYARAQQEGPEFHSIYEALLRDTGQMPAEEVAQKHLGADITTPAFWSSAIDRVAEQLEAFEGLISVSPSRV